MAIRPTESFIINPQFILIPIHKNDVIWQEQNKLCSCNPPPFILTRKQGGSEISAVQRLFSDCRGDHRSPLRICVQ